MKKNIFYCIFLFIFSTSLLAKSDEDGISKTINLKQVYSSNKMEYAKELLIEAYATIGYKIKWLNVASAQELPLVAKAKLAAALAKHPIIEKEFPELIKIPYKLFDFSLLKVSDRRRCGFCLDEDIHSIIYTRGAKISENHINTLRISIDKFAIENPAKLNEMIIKRRADSVLIMDFQLSGEVLNNPHMIVETITREYDYHYLSPFYKHLKEPLTAAFKQLELNGTAEKLRKKHGISSVKALNTIPKKISFISGKWADFSNEDGSGVYWDIIGKVFDKQFDSTKNVTVWAEAISAFEQKRVDILVGAYRKEITSDAIFSSFHLDYSYSLFAYALADDVSARFKSRDASLKACLPREAPFIKHIDFIAKGNIIETEFEQCKILIKNKQVDIIINTESNLDDYVKSLTKISLEKGSPMFLVFHNTPKGHFLKSYFDEKIAKLAQENILNKLFPDIEAFKQAHIRP